MLKFNSIDEKINILIQKDKIKKHQKNKLIILYFIIKISLIKNKS